VTKYVGNICLSFALTSPTFFVPAQAVWLH